MATATKEQKSPNKDELAKKDQVEGASPNAKERAQGPQANVGQNTDESTAKTKQARQEDVEGDVAGSGGLQEYREQLKQRLDEELANLEATQSKVADRLQNENESGNAEDGDFDTQDFVANAAQERADILSIVRSLERQTDTSTKLRDVLEGDVEALQKKLSSEMAARAQLEEKLKSLEASGGTNPKLREENASLRRERDRLASLLEEIKPQLESVTEGRDSLSEEIAFAQKQARELASRKVNLETQVKSLQEKVADTDRLRAEVTKAKEERQVLTEQVRRLMERWEEANKVRDTLETDLAASHEAVCNMRKEMEYLQGGGTGDGSQVSSLRNQLIAQSTELAAANEKLQQETAARRQAEEMLREIKSRLLSLSTNKSVASALRSSGG
jgi:chromosome segregation ATPase